ncbi:MAG TPA: MlaD family protein [Chitinophagaceae bacterium]|nr:MlaD family protein [Chitinophagaceae bacterium]
MKINNELKVGILAIVAILGLVLGFNFLKGKSVFSKSPVLYAVFKQIGSLQKSNEVKINGLPVGTVYDYMPTDKEVNGIIVEIRLTRDISIPANSIAFIDGALVGASYISIEKGPAKEYLESGDTITTRLDAGLMSDIKTQLSPTISRVNETLDSLKLTLGSVNAIFDPTTNGNLQTIIARLALTSASIQQLLNAQTGALARSLNNMDAITGNLAKNNDAVSSSIRNIELTTGNLANAPIQQTLAGLQGAISELKGTITELKGTVTKVNSPNGTLGALLNDRKLYEQLNKAALGLEILLDDVRVHPKRYVNISVFGGKTQSDALTSPTIKDSITIPASKQ